MVTALFETAPKVQHAWVKRWFFTAMALTMIAISIAGFTPAIVNPAGRHARLHRMADIDEWHVRVPRVMPCILLPPPFLFRSGG